MDSCIRSVVRGGVAQNQSESEKNNKEQCSSDGIFPFFRTTKMRQLPDIEEQIGSHFDPIFHVKTIYKLLSNFLVGC